MLGDYKVPPFDENNEWLDLWYITVFDVIEKEMNANLTALKKLVKITLPLAHGNGFLERGLNFTKQINDGRGSLNMASIKGQKTVRDVINMNGGTDKVSIDYCF